MEEVARARLADDPAGAQRVREVAPIPRLAARVVAVEEADFLPGRSGDARVRAQVRVERCRPGLLRAEDQEVRQRPDRCGGPAVSPDGVAKHGPHGVRKRRDVRREATNGRPRGRPWPPRPEPRTTAGLPPPPGARARRARSAARDPRLPRAFRLPPAPPRA